MKTFYFKVNDVSTGFKVLVNEELLVNDSNQYTTIVEQPYNPISSDLFKSKDEIKDFISGSLLTMFPGIKELNN